MNFDLNFCNGEAIGKIVYVLLKNFQNTTLGFLVEKKFYR